MARILYLSANAQGSHDHTYLQGRSFVLELKKYHDVLVRAYVVNDKLATLTSHPIGAKFTDDITDIDEINDFGPDLIFSEMPLIEPHLGWKIPLIWLENFVISGGNVIVAGVNRYGLQGYEASYQGDFEENSSSECNELRDFFQFLGVNPTNRFQSSCNGFPCMREQELSALSEELNLTSQEGISHSNSSTQHRWGWKGQWDGIDFVLLSDPMAISVNTVDGSSTAIATLENMFVLVADIPLFDNYGVVNGSPVAAIRLKGQGYIGTVSAHLISDHLISRAPSNSKWTMRLVELMLIESRKNIEIRSTSFNSPNSKDKVVKDWFEAITDIELAEIIRNEEDINLEYKSSCLGSKDSQAEIMDQICAFANTSGGMLLVGISDTGEIIGIDDELKKVGGRDEYRKRLTSVASRSFLPQNTDLYRLYFITLQGRTVLQIGIRDFGREVIYRKPADGVPVECWIRTNSGKQKLDAFSVVALANQKQSKR